MSTTPSGDMSVQQFESAMVTRVYTFNSWSKHHKSACHGHSLPYVGFPGLTLTPIQESPLLDSVLHEDRADLTRHHEHDKFLQNGSGPDVTPDTWHTKTMKNGSLPGHWLTSGQADSPVEVAPTKQALSSSSSSLSSTRTSSAKSCCINIRMVRMTATSFLPKDEPMTREERRAHLYKLLLFALCGFVIVAGIMLWIFSPSFS